MSFLLKKLYEEMKNRIESAVEVGSIPMEVRDQHKGFSEWDSKITKKDHQSIVQVLVSLIYANGALHYCLILCSFVSIYLYGFFFLFFQILIDGRDTNAIDSDGNRLPTLVYIAREKRPQVHHNFKAGSMNALVIHQYLNE